MIANIQFLIIKPSVRFIVTKQFWRKVSHEHVRQHNLMQWFRDVVVHTCFQTSMLVHAFTPEDTATTGTRLTLSSSRLRIAVVASKPFITGI